MIRRWCLLLFGEFQIPFSSLITSDNLELFQVSKKVFLTPGIPAGALGLTDGDFKLLHEFEEEMQFILEIILEIYFRSFYGNSSNIIFWNPSRNSSDIPGDSQKEWLHFFPGINSNFFFLDSSMTFFCKSCWNSSKNHSRSFDLEFLQELESL